MKMETELQELKSVLRSLVVSSPTEVDLRTLLKDYRNMMGENIPFAKFGYRDGLAFIKEQCGDCFIIQNSGCNPVLTLIVPDAVKHIDKFVQKQKVTPTGKFKCKRRSVPEAQFKNSDLIVKTFKDRANNHQKIEHVIKENNELLHNSSCRDKFVTDNTNDKLISEVYRRTDSGEVTNGTCSSDALEKFMRKRIPLLSGDQHIDSEVCLDEDTSAGDTDSGRQTLSSHSSSRKKAQLEELKMEILELIAVVPEGVWCTELMRLYREKYGRELNFSRFGFTSVLSLAYAVDGLRYCVAEHTGDLLLLREGARVTLPAHPARHSALAPRRDLPTGDPEDALPGIDFDEDVFPRDCMHIMQSVPAQTLDELAPGAMMQVVLGEVYSPTHFWMLRLGPAHYSAMESLMDEMNVYYRGEGRERVLAGGAVRVGHYCACCYLGDWHRAVIVKIVDCDTVKVRHIDYGTVESVAARSLKPLLRRWAALPAQATRARLAGVRPPAAGRRWPWAAAAHFLSLVKERRLVANVVAKDAQESIVEVLLIDTSTDEDVCISTEMCRSGHADSRPDSALGTSECYLYPRFDALEAGDTPNYAEIYCYLRDGISLEFVEDYRRHVPPCLPPPEPLAPYASQRPNRPSPEPCEPCPVSCEASSAPRHPSPAPVKVAAARSLGQLSNRPPTIHVERPASLSPSTDIAAGSKSVAVVNRIPLLRPELSPQPARPPPQRARGPDGYQSLLPSGFPATPPGFPSMHLSPFAPPFYPQSFAPPSHNFFSPFTNFNPERPPVPVPQVPPGGVSLPASECEIFSLLSRVDPSAAHRYMVDALCRAVAAAHVTPTQPPAFQQYGPRPSLGP